VRHLVSASILIDRAKCNGLLLTELSFKRVLIAAVYVASKLLDDVPQPAHYFALLAGISKTELFKLESALLALCDFDVHLSEDLFVERYAQLLGVPSLQLAQI